MNTENIKAFNALSDIAETVMAFQQASTNAPVKEVEHHANIVLKHYGVTLNDDVGLEGIFENIRRGFKNLMEEMKTDKMMASKGYYKTIDDNLEAFERRAKTITTMESPDPIKASIHYSLFRDGNQWRSFKKIAGDLKKSYQELNKGIDLKACQSIGKQFSAVAKLDQYKDIKKGADKAVKAVAKKERDVLSMGKVKGSYYMVSHTDYYGIGIPLFDGKVSLLGGKAALSWREFTLDEVPAMTLEEINEAIAGMKTLVADSKKYDDAIEDFETLSEEMMEVTNQFYRSSFTDDNDINLVFKDLYTASYKLSKMASIIGVAFVLNVVPSYLEFMMSVIRKNLIAYRV